MGMMTEIDTASNFRFTLQDSSSDPSLNSDPDPQKEHGTLENTDHFQLEQDTASGMMTETNTGHNIKSTLQEMNTDTENNIASDPNLMSAGTVDCSYNNSEVINETKDTVRYTEIYETPFTFMETTDHSKLELETASEIRTEIDTASNFRFTLQDSSSDPSLNSDNDPQKEYGTLENTDHLQLEQDTEMNTDTETNIASDPNLISAGTVDCSYNNP